MHIELLDLCHQELIENKFRNLYSFFSEYSFANLYLFRQIHHYQVITYQGEVFIKGLTRDHVSYIMLTSPPTQISPQLLQSILSQAQMLFPISEEWLTSLEKILLQASFKEEDSDYLFATSKLAHFPGRNLSKKRNLVTRFLNQHEVKAEDLSTQFNDARQVLEYWQKQADRHLQTDYTSCLEAFNHFKEFHLHGRLIYVDQQPAGFTIGEWISKDCYAVHFGKALSSIKGLYQYLYQDLAQAVEGNCTWINLEPDLGLIPLRIAKQSYLPDQVLRKWRVQLQKN